MISFNKPTSLNGEQLRIELRAVGVAISDHADAVTDTSDGHIHLDIAAKDQSKASQVVAAHVGIDSTAQLTIAQKLESIGISLDELKAAL
jgi:hypothetical protein